MVSSVLAQVYYALTITMNYKPFLLQIQILEINVSSKAFLPASIVAIYSVSVVEKPTHFCNLVCQDKTPPAKVNKNPEIDF